MITKTADLLLLRLDALAADIRKVRAAVERAEQRGENLRQALDEIEKHRGSIRAAAESLTSLVSAMKSDPDIARLMDQHRRHLDRDLQEAAGELAEAARAVDDSAARLNSAKQMSVTLNDEWLRASRASLNKRCNSLDAKLNELRRRVEASTDDRATQWNDYQNLLDGEAKPVFYDYVDFLGGLTVRDTGLDDQVCDMADRLLTRYKSLIIRSLPLPARQSALSNALDSVVLLGFPEWSIWGIPLLGHEIGMAYLQSNSDEDVLALAGQFVPRVPPLIKPALGEAPPVSKKYVHNLIADIFATYTLGLSYACAVLLLRLSPLDVTPEFGDQPRDIDRARVIMLTLGRMGQSGGSFSDATRDLEDVWHTAVSSNSGSHSTAVSLRPDDPERSWQEDLVESAVGLFDDLIQIPAYNDERWKASESWVEALRDNTESPAWVPYDNSVPDALTAAWRLRLTGDMHGDLAEGLKQRWSNREHE